MYFLLPVPFLCKKLLMKQPLQLFLHTLFGVWLEKSLQHSKLTEVMDITEMQQQYFEVYLLCDLNNVIGSKLFNYAVLNIQFLMVLLYSIKGGRVHLLSARCSNCVICKIVGSRHTIVLGTLSILSITTLLAAASTVKIYLIFELYKTELQLIYSKEWSQLSYCVSETYISSISCL